MCGQLPRSSIKDRVVLVQHRSLEHNAWYSNVVESHFPIPHFDKWFFDNKFQGPDCCKTCVEWGAKQKVENKIHTSRWITNLKFLPWRSMERAIMNCKIEREIPTLRHGTKAIRWFPIVWGALLDIDRNLVRIPVCTLFPFSVAQVKQGTYSRCWDALYGKRISLLSKVKIKIKVPRAFYEFVQQFFLDKHSSNGNCCCLSLSRV